MQGDIERSEMMETVKAKFCSQCGNSLPANAVFCPACGAKIAPTVPLDEPAPPREPCATSDVRTAASPTGDVGQRSVQADQTQGEHLSASTSQTATPFNSKPSKAEASYQSPFYRFCRIASHICFVSFLILLFIPFIMVWTTARELKTSERPPIELLRRPALFGDHVLIIRNMSATKALRGDIRFEGDRWQQGWLPFLIPANEEQELGIVQLKGYKIQANDEGEIRISGYAPWSLRFILDAEWGNAYEWLYNGETIDDYSDPGEATSLCLLLAIILAVMVFVFAVLGRIARVKQKSDAASCPECGGKGDGSPASAGGQVSEAAQHMDEESSLSG